MPKRYCDWADWAGDHPEQAEADLIAEHERKTARAEAAIRERLGLTADADVVFEYSAGSAEPVAAHVIPEPAKED